jgi:hypothetical protein
LCVVGLINPLQRRALVSSIHGFDLNTNENESLNQLVPECQQTLNAKSIDLLLQYAGDSEAL